ncbi:hypothetical protein OG250_42785 [Streptomyces sp. NBC_00487]
MLLSRLPYGKQTPMMGAMLDPLAAARRGFLVVLQDTRGRFASKGSGSRSRMRRATDTTPYGGPPPCRARTAPPA